MKITEALVVEHTIFLGVFDQIERALPHLTTLTEARTLAGIIEGLLESHAETETNLAYLALDHVLEDRGQLDRLHADHQEIDDTLKAVHDAKDCPQARHLLNSAIRASREHFRHEEHSVFPLLEKALQPATLAELAKAWTQRFAPLATDYGRNRRQISPA